MHYDANGSPVEGPGFTPDPPPESLKSLKSLKSLLYGFKFLGDAPFPEHLCVVPDDREESVRNSTDDDYYVVVLVDSRFQSSGDLRVMRPYTAYDPDEDKTFYGWVDENGNFVSHGEHPVYEPDDSKVVAWKSCPKGFDLRA